MSGRSPIIPVPPPLAERIQRLIDALSTDGAEGWLRGICKERLNALPLTENEIYLWALRPDGTVLCLDHEAFALPVHEERDPSVLRSVLREGARRYPEVVALVAAGPRAPDDPRRLPRPSPPLDPARRALAESARTDLLEVLRDARALLARPDNDFTRAAWLGAQPGLDEVDVLIQALRSSPSPPLLAVSILFLPTGPLQETALGSGWGDDFLVLARRCDAALARVEAARRE